MNQDVPLYNAFGIYIGSASLLSSVGNSANDPISPSSISTGQFNAQVAFVSGFLQSSNFKSGSLGWQITAAGDCEFNSGTFRGTLSAVTGSFGAVTIATNGSLSSGQSAYDTGTGFWLGNVSGTTKVSIGNSAANKLTWDGSVLAIVGNLTATTGTIGGWTIGSTTLTGGGVTLNSSTGGISGATITGSTLTTAASGQRVSINSSNITFYDSGGNQSATINGSNKGFYCQTVNAYGAMYLEESGTNAIATIGNQTNAFILDTTDIGFEDGGGNGLFVDTSGKTFVVATYNSAQHTIQQPILFHGYCSGTSITNQNASFTLTNPSTGKYTISHSFGSTAYNAQVTALRASGTGAYVAKVESLNSNDLKVTIFDDTGTVQNGDFMYLITKI